MVARHSLQVLLGGAWHDFPRFSQLLELWLSSENWNSRISFDPGCLLELGLEQPPVVLINTCYDSQTPLKFDVAHVGALTQWVRGGGGLLALHASAVAAGPDASLHPLIGGRFVHHPPKQRFSVKPASLPHPITAGIAAFEIEDEPYELELHVDVNVHLTTTIGERVLPLAWSRQVGKGRVVYLSLGHDDDAWRFPAYRSFVLASLSWAKRS